MHWLRQLSVRSRFHLVMALVTLSLVVTGGWGWLATHSAQRQISSVFADTGASAKDIGDIRAALAGLARYESAMIAVAVSNPTDVERYFAAWKEQLAAMKAAGQRLQQRAGETQSVRAPVAQQAAALEAYGSQIVPIAEQLQAAKMDPSAALAYAQRAEEAMKNMQASALALEQAVGEIGARQRDEIDHSSAAAAVLRLSLVAVTLCLFLPLMWLTLRSICGPLEEASAVATRIAGGDLTQRISVSGGDEPARLLRALAEMQAELHRLVDQVRASSEDIGGATQEVAGGNRTLSERSEHAAENLQRAASAMTQIAQTVSGTAAAARTANELALSAAGVASRGGDVVTRVVGTMSEIHGSSKRIADIIGVIDGIAFQTNILALNAAVEAARAGEQGRGFAVVASEVRSLAQRSAEAAREIKALIGSSVERVEAGSQLVQEAGATMAQIVASVQRLNAVVGDISVASDEQNRGIGEITNSVAELDRMTQDNALLVRQSADAAHGLAQQAGRLESVVAAFKLQPAG